MESELKPCPFCGGKARISADTEATRDSKGRPWAFTAVCDKCCATSGLTFSTERAIEAWNRRAEDESEQNFQFARTLSMKDISEINRVLGIIDGLSYAVQDSGIADGLVCAVERIEAVVNKED